MGFGVNVAVKINSFIFWTCVFSCFGLQLLYPSRFESNLKTATVASHSVVNPVTVVPVPFRLDHNKVVLQIPKQVNFYTRL